MTNDTTTNSDPVQHGDLTQQAPMSPDLREPESDDPDQDMPPSHDDEEMDEEIDDTGMDDTERDASDDQWPEPSLVIETDASTVEPSSGPVS
jgi:hypothetical protein